MTMTEKDKRTLRFGSIAIGIYLVLFGGFKLWKSMELRRAEYQKMVQEAQNLKYELQPYEDKVVVLKNLMESFRLDPSKLSKPLVVAEASAAIQKAATSGGLQMGPVRETSARATSKELASIQMETTGQLPAVLGFLHRLESIGFPLILDSVAINSEPSKPGMVKVNLSIILLDFEQWKKEGMPNV